MAEPVEYIITIKLDGAENLEEESKTAPVTPATAAKSDGEEVSPGKKKSGKKKQAIAKGIAAYHYAKAVADTFIANEINTIELRTGRAQLQARMQTSYDIGKRIWSIGESIAIGAMIGGAVGAVVGAVGSVAMQAVSIGIEQHNLNLERAVEEAGLAQAQIRAGTSGNRGGRNSG